MKKRKITIIYLVFGLLWVILTDFFVGRYASLESIMMFQKIKGLIYVGITAFFIYFVLGKIEELNNTKEQEKKLTTIINSMVDFISIKDKDGKLVEMNEYGLELLQLDNIEYRGKKASEIVEIPSHYRKAMICCEKVDEHVWRLGKKYSFEEEILFPNGSKKHFNIVKLPLYHEDGRRKELVIIGRDVTKMKLVEDQLSKREKLSVVGELAASVGHEIRNPLTSIKGFIQLLEKEDEKNKFYYNIMLTELDRINHIVGELLILAKPQKVEFTSCDVSTILNDVVCLLQTQASMNNVTISYYVDGEILIDCEKNQLKQLFINIVKNAIEASNEKGIISVKIIRNKLEKVCIVVEDQGIGIPDEFLKRIGEPFYSSKEKGTGLGLTVSHKIIEMHGGKISYERIEPKGTRVSIELPIKNELHA
ncbi:ATP-binding protein [Evansella sp. AB-P1]|uniref:ATP-binding protein n=1 Tax=Evansella sp. AB-P1 TaxID=3037653 RepID=UPI00241CFC20|nr:ATP-binding protein [Evansella sp. AB-P1]MDG5789835.1 ATP-binding protein [Evansella sp. AB-P1]